MSSDSNKPRKKTEAVAFLGQRLDDIDMPSIGATTTPFNIARL